MYISETINYIRRYDLEHDDIEAIWIQINLTNSKPFVLGFVYRPPQSNNDWIHLFNTRLKLIEDHKLETHFLGDFNINFYPDGISNDFSNKAWASTIGKRGFKQLINTPTRVNKLTSSIIDHIYSNRYEVITETNVPQYAISDHQPVCFTRFSGSKICKNDHIFITYRSFRKFSEESFQRDLAITSFETVEMEENVNSSLSLFYLILNNIISHHAPYKKKRIKRKIQPNWINEEILNSIRKRDYLHKKKDYLNYKIARNKTNKLIKQSKSNFFNKAVSENRNINEFWKNMKQVKSDTKSKATLPNTLSINGNILDNKALIANQLNEHFINIADFINKVNFNEKYFSSLRQTLKQKLGNNVFELQPITVYEVSKIIKNLNSNKSTGLDGLGPKLIKMCGDYITQPLAFIINKSISHGLFPEDLKRAYVIPIHKSGPKTDPNNYRPISILPTISKIFERHVATQLLNFLKQFDLLYINQSGFRANHSCCTALIKLIDSWLAEIDSNKYVGSIYLDLKKAFDLVDHDILIQKMKLYNFSENTLNFFQSYLSNRIQVVKDGDIISSSKTIKSGVPQGSILGPILFLIYINDMHMKLSASSSIDMYADDSTLHSSDYDKKNIEQNLQHDVNEIEEWCKMNNMAINPKKSKCMLLGTNNKLKEHASLNIYINNVELENVTSHKLMGVYINSNLKWSKQCSYVYNKMQSRLHLLKRLSSYLTSDMKVLFYNAHILSIFDYCCPVWANTTKTEIMKVYNVQKKAAKIILKKGNGYQALTLYKELNWLSFENRLRYHTAILIYKVINGECPAYMTNLISIASNNSYNLRSSTNLSITIKQFPRTKYLKNSFVFLSRNVWNSIPANIRLMPNLNLFKLQLKLYLQNSQN